MNNKKLIVFDLDDTLTASKSPMDPVMVVAFQKLLEVKKVAVISGGSYSQFQKQITNCLNENTKLENLFLFPNCSTRFYQYQNGWKEVYADTLTEDDKKKILSAFEKAFAELNYKHPETTYGEIIEDRGTQITFSAAGQNAPLEVKRSWDPDQKKRLEIRNVLMKYIPEFEAHVAGTTSIDVTRKGINKTYGIQQIEKHLGISQKEMLFVGDALFEGGNDYPVKAMGVDCEEVRNPQDTVKLIEKMVEAT